MSEEVDIKRMKFWPLCHEESRRCWMQAHYVTLSGKAVGANVEIAWHYRSDDLAHKIAREMCREKIGRFLFEQATTTGGDRVK